MSTQLSANPAAGAAGGLPELASVSWRPRVSERSLRRTGRLWTLSTVAHTVPLLGAAVFLFTVNPVTVPIGVIVLAHAWMIPELYAARGGNVVRLRAPAGRDAERRAMLLLGDLVNGRARELLAHSGLVLERGRLGTWLVGEAGAVLIRPGGRRVHCYCVKVTDPSLPSSDRREPRVLRSPMAASPEGVGECEGGARRGRAGARLSGPLTAPICSYGQGCRGKLGSVRRIDAQELCTDGQCAL